MNQRAFQIVFPAALVVVMAAFLSAIFFASATPSFAASAAKKSVSVARATAVEHTQAQIKQLKDALKITEAQQVSWNNLTQVMLENAKEMDALTRDRAENIKTMNAVEYMKFHSQISEARLGQQKKLIPTFETFYAGLSDEQKKITDTIFRTGKHGNRKIQ
jgi:hypothetical protein